MLASMRVISLPTGIQWYQSQTNLALGVGLVPTHELASAFGKTSALGKGYDCNPEQWNFPYYCKSPHKKDRSFDIISCGVSKRYQTSGVFVCNAVRPRVLVVAWIVTWMRYHFPLCFISNAKRGPRQSTHTCRSLNCTSVERALPLAPTPIW